MGLARRPRLHSTIGTAMVLAAVLAACAGSTPEQRLRETVGTLQHAVEAREARSVGAVLADDFVGPQGLDRDGAIGMARVAFLRHRRVGVAIVGPLDVRMLPPGHATVRFSAALTGGSGGLLPDSARLYDVETGWRLEGGDWHLASATWEPRL